MKHQAFAVILAMAPPAALAGMEVFKPGAVIEGYGRVAEVPGAASIPRDSRFKVAFDLRAAAEEGEVNRGLDTAARFLNMHAAAGIPVENIRLAVVVHGGGHRDLLSAESTGGVNPNAGLIAQLVGNNVRIILCGQTAAYYGVDAKDLLPGVEMSLSAMTAHALLQQQGYTLNPF